MKIPHLILSVSIALIAISASANEKSLLRPAPRAVCGPQDRTETRQGQTTLAERFAPGPDRAFQCNLELVGQFEGEGSHSGLDVVENCAYFSVTNNEGAKHPGLAVIDVSDSANPKPVLYLNTPTMLAAAESVAVAPKSQLLLASKME